jgi:methyltransferase (TIGR00027 family)
VSARRQRSSRWGGHCPAGCRLPDALIDDPFAEPLVRAVGMGFFTRILNGELDPGDADGGAAYGLTRLTRMMAVRTRLIDDFFADARAAGIRQVVILAAGLDSRAYRLRWAADTTVYEVDQPPVLEFKTRTMAQIGAAPTARRHTVAIDLREQWAPVLRASGFDPAQPTVWSAEGLVDYLPGATQNTMAHVFESYRQPLSESGHDTIGLGSTVYLTATRT